MPLDAASGRADPSARPFSWPSKGRIAAPHTALDLEVLALTCWAEPIGGSLRGMEIVAATALNFWRIRREFEDDLTVAGACQDSGRFECWARPRPPAPQPNDPRFAMARRAARRALNYGPFLGQSLDPTNGAAGYAPLAEKTPDWATGLTPMAVLRGLRLYSTESARPFLAPA